MTQRDFLAFAQRVKSAGISFSEAKKKFELAMGKCLVGQKKREVDRGYVDGVKTLPDGREIVTAPVMRQRVREAWTRDEGLCGICKCFVRVDQAVPDHIAPRGMNGARRDDRLANIQPAHARCNNEKGSNRNYHAGAGK